MTIQDREEMPRLSTPEITAEGELRGKNQITVPKAVIEVTGFRPGDRLMFVVDPKNPGVVHLRRLPESYAGVLADAFESPEDAHAYLHQEQESWDE